MHEPYSPHHHRQDPQRDKGLEGGSVERALVLGTVYRHLLLCLMCTNHVITPRREIDPATQKNKAGWLSKMGAHLPPQQLCVVGTPSPDTEIVGPDREMVVMWWFLGTHTADDAENDHARFFHFLPAFSEIRLPHDLVHEGASARRSF